MSTNKLFQVGDILRALQDITYYMPKGQHLKVTHIDDVEMRIKRVGHDDTREVCLRKDPDVTMEEFFISLLPHLEVINE